MKKFIFEEKFISYADVEIYAHYDTSSWICKDLQRKDPFTKPFCYNEKHENYYKNHMEVA